MKRFTHVTKQKNNNEKRTTNNIYIIKQTHSKQEHRPPEHYRPEGNVVQLNFLWKSALECQSRGFKFQAHPAYKSVPSAMLLWQ